LAVGIKVGTVARHLQLRRSFSTATKKTPFSASWLAVMWEDFPLPAATGGGFDGNAVGMTDNVDCDERNGR
jgi:hypothetical protein